MRGEATQKKSEELEVVKAERKEEAKVRVGDTAPGLSQRRHRAVRAGRVSNIEQFGEWDSSKMEWPLRGTRDAMPNDSRRRAAEYHELAAHAHRAAAAHHGKEDHQTGHEHSKQALEHANKAFQWSQEAHRKSEKSTGKP